MIKIYFILFSLQIIYLSENKFGYNTMKDVIILDNKNFDEFIKKHELAMVEFYAPWCNHCKELEPKYSEFAKKMADEHNIPVAKVDATEETELANRFNIEGYPTLRLFVKGLSIEYNGKQDVKSMIDFVINLNKDPTKEINTEEELNKLKEENKAIVVFYGEEGNDFNSFKEAALENNKIKFYFILNNTLKEKLKFKNNSVILFKQFDEKENIIEEYDSKSLNEFIENNRFPNILEFSKETGTKLFGGGDTNTIFLFQDKESENNKIFEELAKEMKNKIYFCTSTINSGIGNKLAIHLGAEKPDEIILVKFNNSNVNKYKLKEEFTKENLVKFIQDFFDNKLKDFYKSKPIPENNDKSLKEVVGENFEEIVLDKSKNVLLEVYSDSCSHCQKFAPVYKKIAETLSDYPDLIIAKINGVNNEFPGLEIKSFPEIYLYKKEDKSNPIKYEGVRQFFTVIKFLEKNNVVDLNNRESKKEDEEIKKVEL